MNGNDTSNILTMNLAHWSVKGILIEIHVSHIQRESYMYSAIGGGGGRGG